MCLYCIAEQARNTGVTKLYLLSFLRFFHPPCPLKKGELALRYEPIPPFKGARGMIF